MKRWTLKPVFYTGLSLLVLLTGCAGYRVGNIGGKEIQGVRSVYVPVVKNMSFEPGLQVMTTNAIIRRFDTDGTLSTAASANADSELNVTITKITKNPLRGNRNDGVRTAQMEVIIEAKATFINRRLGRTVLENTAVSGTTTYFLQADQTESERQALPLAADDLANNIVKLITEGW